MGDGHMFDYDHCHRSAFIERKCNFRLALMYFKSFLFSPLANTGWKRQLTIDVQDARGSRKHSLMCFSAHMASVFVQQLGLRPLQPLRKHLHVHSLLQLFVAVCHNGLQEAQYIGKVLHLYLMTVYGRWSSKLSRNNSPLVGHIQGCISQHWGRANTLYCQERLHQGDSTLHAVWTSNLVSGMWQYGINQWVGRNEFLYGKTKEERLTKKTQEMDSQILHMHRADRKRVRPTDKHLFYMPAE